MIPLSQAIRTRAHLHPLDAALASLQAVPSWTLRAVHSLHNAWPQLGQSVRAWPALAAELEAGGIVPSVKKWTLRYRAEIHVSLWRALDLMERAGWSSTRVADLLKARGL